jgi:hypothetical protein|tara:strand:+ start:4518 stop:4859 length:342 start_codon:yes stop_codon:yes gene_type:complete
MPLKGRAKRNYNRTIRYGNWRQIYHDNLGMCRKCGAVDKLEIHEETDGIAVISWQLLCIDCHLELPGHRGDRSSRRYLSKLQEDINAEVTDYGGLKNWKKAFNIKEGTNERTV